MKLTVGIITRNRQRLLSKCLRSLINNNVLPDEVIIIDNNSSDKTKNVVENFKKTFPNTKYCIEKSIGRPQARKKLFSVFKGKILAITDDDCTFDKHWIENIEQTFRKSPHTQVVQGISMSKHSNKLIENNIQLRQDSWFKRNTFKNQIQILDTKNCALRSNVIKKIKIDKNLVGEDIDIARQLVNKNIKILLNKKILVFHQERPLFSLAIQSFRMGIFDVQIKNKWGPIKEIGEIVRPRFSYLCKPLLTVPFRLGSYYQRATYKVRKIFN